MNWIKKFCERGQRCSCFFDSLGKRYWGDCCERHDKACLSAKSDIELHIAHIAFYNCLKTKMPKFFAWIMFQVVKRTTKKYLKEFK